MWGKKVADDELNFHWPTQEILDGLNPDVYLQSLQLKGVRNLVLSSVRVTLSNGLVSPVFE